MPGIVTNPTQIGQADRFIFSRPIASRTVYEKSGGVNQNVVGKDKTEVPTIRSVPELSNSLLKSIGTPDEKILIPFHRKKASLSR